MKYFLLCLAQSAAISLAAPASASPFYPTEAAVFFSPNGGAEKADPKELAKKAVEIPGKLGNFLPLYEKDIVKIYKLMR